MKPNRQTTIEPWYTEQAGFFGPRYFTEYANNITPERTRAEIDALEKTLRLQRGMKILDLACGHGRHTISLALRGYHMTGQDLNAFFLNEAKQSAQRAGVDIRWVQSDMRHIPFEHEFDLVVNLFTAFGYLECDDEDQRVLYQVAKALLPQGRFVLDMINRDRIMRVFRERDWAEFSDGSAVFTERRFDLVSGRNYERRVRIRNDGNREEIQTVVRMYTLPELIAMCQAAGLQLDQVYGDYNGEPLSLDSKRYVLITKKSQMNAPRSKLRGIFNCKERSKLRGIRPGKRMNLGISVGTKPYIT